MPPRDRPPIQAQIPLAEAVPGTAPAPETLPAAASRNAALVDPVAQVDPVEATAIDGRPLTVQFVPTGVPIGSHPTIYRRISGGFEWLFGAGCLILILAVLATAPLLQFLSLGYLLAVAAGVARTGRLRDGLMGVRQAARIGSLVVGTWLWLLPLRLLASLLQDAKLIDPHSSITAGLRISLALLTGLVLSHIVWAWFRGGRFRHFLWPAPFQLIRQLRTGGMMSTARDAVWRFVVSLRAPYFFWLGFRGFVGAFLWLVIPITMLAFASRIGNGLGVMIGLLGGLSLATVLLYLPFLQTQFAVENNFRAMFDVATVRRLFRQAPIAFWFAITITLLFAVPLYLLKIELTPREVAWLPSLVFVVFIFPARLLTGWAMGRAFRHGQRRHFIFRWSSRLAAIPVVSFYTLIVYATQYLSWYGAFSLYEQHAFLVPVPFLGM